MMELSEISVGDELVLENDAEGEPVVVGKVGTRCVYATNYERGCGGRCPRAVFPAASRPRGQR